MIKKLNEVKVNSLSKIKELTDIYSRCIHCGMCLSDCPTYDLTKLERSSPRGRIKLIKSAAEGNLQITSTFAYEMNFCLDCQACETACPAGVKFGTIIEAAREEVENKGYTSTAKSFFLKWVIPYKTRLKIIMRIIRFYQVSGTQKFFRSSGILKRLFPKLSKIDDMSPDVPEYFSDGFIKEINRVDGSEKFKLAFSYGCLMNVLFPEVNKDTLELLNKIGATVISPLNQTCCGSLNAHNGDFKTARKLAEKNIKEFEGYDYDFLISNSAGCGAFMKQYGELFKEDEEFAYKAQIFASKVKDVTEFLTEAGIKLKCKNYKKDITYHDACHHVHSQKIYAQPRNILSNIPEINLIPLEDSTKCCGSAGIYNLLHYDTSMELLNQKINNIVKTGVETVLTGNPGCLLQLKYGMQKSNQNIRVMHIASFLNELIDSNLIS